MEEETKDNETVEEETKDVIEDKAPAVEEAKTAGGEPAIEGEEKPLDKMTTPELKEVAMKIPGVTGVTAMKKDQLLALIKEYRGIVDETPAKKKKAKVASTIKEMKQQIVRLKKDKESAKEEKDRKKINVFRRRINRLKKRTRKVIAA